MKFDIATPQPEEATGLILNCTGQKFDSETAAELWPKIMQHKWFLSEKLSRDVGFKVACLDYIENVEPLISELGARSMDRSIWENISETQPPKQIINKRIIIPLTQVPLAQKHGVIPPKTIIFFGPPGTGKTTFVQGIAGVLRWRYVEVSPSTLMADGESRIGTNLKRVMEKVRSLNEVMVFIDEFEEIAASRDHASRIDKSITNEFLKQVPPLKKADKKILLVCATNYITQLDSALLRPGRFDCIIPVGPLDDESRMDVFRRYLAGTNHGEVDIEKIVPMLKMFTPADIEYLFQKVKQHTFEKEFAMGEDSRVTTETFFELIPRLRPTLTKEIIEKFQEDCDRYTRF